MAFCKENKVLVILSVCASQCAFERYHNANMVQYKAQCNMDHSAIYRNNSRITLSRLV